MAILPANYYRNAGMTLIEVLIALAIISIAMTAVIKATAQTIRSNNHLQNKTMALWVGQQVLNEALSGVRKLPEESDQIMENTVLLDRTWFWQAYQTTTPNSSIKKIAVDVRMSESEEAEPMIHLESYVYHVA